MLCCIDNLGSECAEEDRYFSRRGMLIASYSVEERILLIFEVDRMNNSISIVDRHICMNSSQNQYNTKYYIWMK